MAIAPSRGVMSSHLRILAIAAILVGCGSVVSAEAQQAKSPVETLQVAAASGSSAAMYALARRYNSGDGVEKNYEQAVAWFRKAASAGNADAMHRLAIAYNNGHGVMQDDAQAAAWYRRAADLGQGSSMFYLGTMYWGGRGVKQDYAEAFKWLSLAAIHGPADERQRNADARDLLGRASQMTPELLAEARERIAAWQQVFDSRKK